MLFTLHALVILSLLSLKHEPEHENVQFPVSSPLYMVFSMKMVSTDYLSQYFQALPKQLSGHNVHCICNIG